MRDVDTARHGTVRTIHGYDMCLATRWLARTHAHRPPSPNRPSRREGKRGQCRCNARGSRLAIARHTGLAFHSSDRRTASAVRGHTVQHVPRRYVVRVRDRPARNERSTSGPLSHSLSDELCFCAAGARGQGIRRLLFAAHSSKKGPPPLARDIIRPGSPVFTFAVQPGPRKQKKNSPRGRRHPPPPQSQLHARSSASQLPCTLSSPSHRKEKRIPVAFAHHTPPSPPAMPSVIREWHFEKKKQGKRPQWPISIVLLEGGG